MQIIQLKKLNKLKLVVVGGVFFLGLLIYDIVSYVISIYESSLFFGTIFSIVGLLFAYLMIIFIKKEIRGFSDLKKVNLLYLKSQELKIQPSRRNLVFLWELISFYKKSDIFEIQIELDDLKEKLKYDNIFYNEAIELFETNILQKLDRQAHKKIDGFIAQTAFATALSPVAIIDSIFVMWRNITMIGEIAKIYGFTPTFTFKIFLTKQILKSVVFATVAQTMSEYGSFLIGNSLLSKISFSASEGVANGILTAKIGYNTIKFCRPIDNKTLKKNRLKSSINKMLIQLRKKIKG